MCYTLDMNTLVGLCAIGAERILGNEIKALFSHLGHRVSIDSRRTAGRVTFTVDDDDAPMLCCLCLRTCDRILLQMAQCHVETFDDLFDCVYLVDWEELFRKDCRIVVSKARTHYSMLESGRSIQAVVQKAIYTKLGDKWHITALPETGDTHTVRVYIEDDIAQVLLDISGDALHRRGYRAGGGAGGIAPLRETTAAAILQEMLWRRKTPLVDPFCGSGTILAEASLYAHDIAPGLGRRFALEKLQGHDAKKMEELRQKLSLVIRTDVEVRISGSDIDTAAVERARSNVEKALAMAGRAMQKAGRDEKIPRPNIVVFDALKRTAETESGLVLTNPPYGERMLDEEKSIELYRNMKVMWEHFPHWQFGILTPCQDFAQIIGRRASKVKSIKAGNLETRLYVYDERRDGGKNDNRRT